MASKADLPLIALCAEGIEIPGSIRDLRRFRDWVGSDAFPDRGRIDWIAGRMEVDMSPGDLSTHGTPKSAIAGKLVGLVQETERGLVFIDRARLSSPIADLSCEPDVLVVLAETLESGSARLIPRVGGEERYIEIEGAVDVAVECISEASAPKDRERLPSAYHRAGVREYWLVDARGDALDFQILRRGKEGYEAVPPNSDGFVASEVLGASFRLIRRRRSATLTFYRLEVR
jgi:Uma2 family endonuclease